MSADLKTSILVNRQVPEFVRDEYPKFVTFLEAYYEFLEAQANTATTSNNLITTAKSLRNIADIDESLDRFEKNFYNTYGSLVPLDVQSNKALLFKQLLPLYRTKGSENSFKLLFQLVFGEDIDVILPKNNVLRASASNWQVDNKLRINPDISSRYVGNGTTKTFYLAQQVGTDEVSIFVDNVLKTAGTDYFINKEYRQLNFVTAPTSGAVITATYENFNIALLNNRKLTGITSGATAIIESASRRIISDTLNLGLPVELLINPKTLDGSFLNGEIVTIPVNDEVNNILIDIRASTFSIVRKINVIAGGNNYSVGDAVTVIGGNATTNAFGTIERVVTGKIDTVFVYHGGALFSVTSPISVSGNNPLSNLVVVVNEVDDTGANSANSFTVSPDVVSNLSLNVGGTVYLNSSNWGAVFSKSNISASNTIADALNYITISQVGPIKNVAILGTPTIPLTEKNLVVLDGGGVQYGPSNTSYRYSKSLRSIGRYRILDGGLNYQIGDEIVFGSNPPGTYGQHAAATVTKIAANGYIERIDSANSRIRGVVSATAACNEIVGTGTFFQQDLKIGDRIDVNNESKIVTNIPTNVDVVVDSVFTYSTSNKKLGVYNRWPLGGYGYTQNNFPTVTVDSATGAGAIIQIDSLIGDGERLAATGFGANGQIISIKVVNPGSGYEYNPIVSISGGDGTATANTEIERSYASSPGRWTTSDSIISSTERKIQGEDYYVEYSYIISSQTEFSKYKTMLKQLLHPVGMVNYAFYNKQNVVELTDVAVQDILGNTISGLVNVGNGRIIVSGIGTKFNIAIDRGILSLGSMIAVNGEIRKINTIISNTTLLTSSNISNLTIANSGSGYSNGYLVFSGGGGQVTGLTITSAGSGYENGVLNFTGTDESIAAVANVEVHASNGVIRTLTLISGGLYSGVPIALPNTNQHRVVYANSIAIESRGEGYSNGYLVFSGGAPLRDAIVRVIVHPNTTINTIVVDDSGLYQTNPTAVPNTNPNVVISAVTVTSKGNGHSNGVLTFSGGNPSRAATVRVETFPPASAQVAAIAIVNSTGANTAANGYVTFSGGGEDNIGANARIFVNSSRVVTSVQLIDGGTYIGTPNASFAIGNTNFTLTMNSLDGQIRKVTIVDPGLYTSTPTAVLNTTPISVSGIAANTAEYKGRFIANGYLVFSGGNPIIPANASYEVYGANGVIRSITINHAGLYRSAPTVAPNVTPVSVTEAYPMEPGFGYSAGYLVLSTNQETANVNANVSVTVNAGGAISGTIINNVGLYANGLDIIVVGVLDPTTGTLQSPTSAATFRIGYAANTLNVANLIVTTAANAGQTAAVTITANSNNYTNAVFSVVAVANDQTNAVITIGFTDRNTAAVASVEVYPVKVNTITANAESTTVNSFITFYTDNGTQMEAANARVYVNTYGYVVNVTVSGNGAYSKAPIANISSLRYVENNQVFDATTNSQTNVAFTLTTTGNGAIRKLTTSSVGEYYYTPSVTPNSAGSGAVITFNPVSWYQTANSQTAIIYK